MNLNIVQICGRLTSKPESKVMTTGKAVSTFSVATNRTWKDKSGQKQTEVEFHNVVAFGRTAEIICQYFEKGDEIYIQGRLKTNSWQTKDGTKRSKTDIVAEKLDFGQKARPGGNQTPKTMTQGVNQATDNEPEPDFSQGSVEGEEIDVSKIPF